MFIQAFPSGPLSTNAYVVICLQTGEVAIVDPAPDSFQKIQAFLIDQKQQLKVNKILLTHSHWDHIAAIAQFKEVYPLAVYVHPLDAPNLCQPGIDGLPCWLSIAPIQPDILLEDNMQISIGQLTFDILHTPGHSPGSVCFYEPQQQALLSGDTLFQGTIGNLSFPTSQPALMWPSLARLAQLPPKTRVLPGHGGETTIGAEASWLPFAEKLFDN